MKLGDKVKDLVTGLVGILTGYSIYLNGCVRWLVVPHADKDNKPVEGQWIDEPQLQVIKPGVVKAATAITGGPRPHPTRQVPTR